MINAAISCIAWPNEQHEQVSALLQKFKILALEAAPGLFSCPLDAVTSEQIYAEKQFWAEKNIAIQAMQALLYGRPELNLFGTAHEREILASYLQKVFKVAQGLGAKSLVFGSPKNRQRGKLALPEALTIAVEFFSKIAPYAHEQGCTLCIEANAKDYQCDFITNHTEAIELVQAVNKQGFGLQIDAGVMQMNNEKPEMLAKQLDAAGIMPQHVHISMPFLEPVTMDAYPLFSELKRQLDKREYKGFYSIEMKCVAKEHTEKALTNALNTIMNMDNNI